MQNKIILAAMEEINVRGFKFTMSDLTKRLSISKSSLYEHFSSKTELIGTILDIILNEYRMQEDRIIDSNLPTLEKLRSLLTVTPQICEPIPNRVYEDLRLTYPEEWKKVLVLRQERMDRIVDLLVQGMEEETIRNVKIGIVQQMIISTMDDLLKYRFLTANNMTYQDALNAMLDVIINGIAAKE